MGLGSGTGQNSSQLSLSLRFVSPKWLQGHAVAIVAETFDSLQTSFTGTAAEFRLDPRAGWRFHRLSEIA
jgi:hypothetical protein